MNNDEELKQQASLRTAGISAGSPLRERFTLGSHRDALARMVGMLEDLVSYATGIADYLDGGRPTDREEKNPTPPAGGMLDAMGMLETRIFALLSQLGQINNRIEMTLGRQDGAKIPGAGR
jgi:hypothetical protein